LLFIPTKKAVLTMQTTITEGFRLSPHQEHLWLIQQVDQAFQYRVQGAVLIEGNINTKYSVPHFVTCQE